MPMLPIDVAFPTDDPGNFLRMKLNGQGLTEVRNTASRAVNEALYTATERGILSIKLDTEDALLIYDIVRLALALPPSEIERIGM